MTYATPLGKILIAGDENGLRLMSFQTGKDPERAEPEWIESPEVFGETTSQLDEYFAGKRRDFDLNLAPRGTDFQLEVWTELQRIPYGRTISYGELAERIRRPRAVRAVGAANGANPLPLVIPCHRVIGADGSLTGYGGGLEIKENLLAHEGARLSF